MSYLVGLKEYLVASSARSVFAEAMQAQTPWVLHVHGQRIVQARIVGNDVYDVHLETADGQRNVLPKLQIKLTYPAACADAVPRLLKSDPTVRVKGLQTIQAVRERHFIKNKTLFLLRQDRQVAFLTLLEGEVVRGIVADFSQYDIVVHLKGGLSVVILRHSVYDARDKHGRCLLKTFQDTHKDWQHSALFVG